MHVHTHAPVCVLLDYTEPDLHVLHVTSRARSKKFLSLVSTAHP